MSEFSEDGEIVEVPNDMTEDYLNLVKNERDITYYILGEIQKIRDGCSLSIITRRLRWIIKPEDVRRVVQERKDMFELSTIKGSSEEVLWVVG